MYLSPIDLSQCLVPLQVVHLDSGSLLCSSVKLQDRHPKCDVTFPIIVSFFGSMIEHIR